MERFMIGELEAKTGRAGSLTTGVELRSLGVARIGTTVLRIFLVFMLIYSRFAAAGEASFTKPEVIIYGASVAEIARALNGVCISRQTRRINPPFQKDVAREQMQIDCEGFPFQNGSRHAEFVFRDDALMMVWIMTGKTEDAALEQAMTATYGSPKKRGRTYLEYKKGLAALRLDKHEVLFYGPAMAREIETWFVDADSKK
jgi:hypothetical protein